MPENSLDHTPAKAFCEAVREALKRAGEAGEPRWQDPRHQGVRQPIRWTTERYDEIMKGFE